MRTWNDYKNRLLRKGAFTDQEIKALMQSICEFVNLHKLGIDGLVKLCSSNKGEMADDLKGAWCAIAESLPNRSVQACHNVCRRKFNRNNYGGKWSQ